MQAWTGGKRRRLKIQEAKKKGSFTSISQPGANRSLRLPLRTPSQQPPSPHLCHSSLYELIQGQQQQQQQQQSNVLQHDSGSLLDSLVTQSVGLQLTQKTQHAAQQQQQLRDQKDVMTSPTSRQGPLASPSSVTHPSLTIAQSIIQNQNRTANAGFVHGPSKRLTARPRFQQSANNLDLQLLLGEEVLKKQEILLKL